MNVRAYLHFLAGLCLLFALGCKGPSDGELAIVKPKSSGGPSSDPHISGVSDTDLNLIAEDTGETDEKPSFKLNILCSRNGDHEGLHDYDVSQEQESMILREAIYLSYQHLDGVKHPQEKDFGKTLKTLLPELTYVINHEPTFNEGGSVGGYSAEDDPDYVYPDQDLYPEGSIKVNITQTMIPQLESAEGSISQIRQKVYLAMVIAHEITHAWQYKTNPVPDLVRVPEAIVEGLLQDTEVYAGHVQKIGYEQDANFVDTSFLKNYLKNVGGNHEAIEPSRDFTEHQQRTYYGQIVPVNIVYQLEQHLTGQIELKNLDELTKQWNFYVESDPEHFKRMYKQYPYVYLKDVETRYQSLSQELRAGNEGP